MDDLQFGKRNKRGDWAPDARLDIAPFWSRRPDPVKILKWVPGYFWPWSLFFFATALLWWRFVIPDTETLKTLSWGWVLRLYLINAVAIALYYGAFELRLYWQRAQGTRFKYNGKFPGDQKSDVFWFGSQNIDNAVRTLSIGVGSWTAVEVGMLWAYANGYAPWLGFAEHPVLVGLVFLFVPMLHEAHFYLIHRLIHIPVLYKWIHSVHHNSVNPSPWSSLSMHPIEALAYFGVMLWHLILPSNPVLALYQLHFAGFGAAGGHIGFDKIELGEGALDTPAYTHYLHHKYFEVNYADGVVPFDYLFGTWHDGSPEAQARMEARFAAKRARVNRKAG
jgi:sterol desaturase/sphingolipid hydroxylase (fatty acid hydroxylase superfamily)